LRLAAAARGGAGSASLFVPGGPVLGTMGREGENPVIFMGKWQKILKKVLTDGLFCIKI
jgi:hypothetical protein